MIFGIPLYIVFAIFDMVVLIPLSWIGGLVNWLGGGWLQVFQNGLAFTLKPLFMLQFMMDVPMALNAIGWCFGVFVTWVVWNVIVTIASWFRGTGDLHLEKLAVTDRVQATYTGDVK